MLYDVSRENAMPECRLEYILSYVLELKTPPEVIGSLPEGMRANFYFGGGTFEGPRMRGKVLPVGADYLLLRTDGIGVLDVRATFETHDGALIYVAYSGILETGPDGYERFLRNDLPPIMALRSAPRFHTANPGYAWLNRVQCIGVGQADLKENRVSYDVYAAP
jgi:hypothetical protein